jgi:hypothetical protein
MMFEIKLAPAEKFEEIWPIIHAVLKKGDTYPLQQTDRATLNR